MHIVLVRHGIAIDREDPACPPDPERALTEQGRERTHYAALGLRALEISPGAILTSPYVRAVQTAELIAAALKVAPEGIERTELLVPDAPPRPALGLILSRAGTAGTVLVTGHAPNLDLVLAAMFDRDEPFTELKKAGAAAVEVTPEGPVLRWLHEPWALRKLGR